MPRTLIAALLASYCLAASAAFKCVDDKGTSHYEDVPPAACANVVIYEVNRSGAVIRKIEPAQASRAPTAEEKQKKSENDRAALDRQRRDRTLLDTFASEHEIDTARDRSVNLVKARMESVERQLELVRKRRQQLEASPHKQATAIKSQVEAARAEEAQLEHSVAGYRAEMERVQKQFDTDKSRWQELRGQGAKR